MGKEDDERITMKYSLIILYLLLNILSGCGSSSDSLNDDNGDTNECTKTVFLTSLRYEGDFGGSGLASADSACQARASAAGLSNSGNFIAWLSTSTVDAIDRLSSDAVWCLTNGTSIVARDRADLIDGVLGSRINMDEDGNTISSNMNVWTGTKADGTNGGENTCSDWTLNSGGSARMGTAMFPNTSWTEFSTMTTCGNTWRLYCFEN